MKKITLLGLALLGAFASKAQGCSELFFSEYAEGSSNNKYLEIYNPTSTAISLSGYSVKLYGNGSTTAGNTLNFPASASIAAHGTYVIANSSADATILAFADTTSTVTYYNGDDAVVLFGGTDTLDIIGIVGNDPGTNWTVGTGATSEYTLVRMASVNAGTTNWTLSATQWDVYAQNTWTYGGAHTSNCAVVSSGCNELFISEYSEGSSNNKYLELYNPTASAVNLSTYSVKLYGNGSTTAGNTLTFPASASIAAYGTYVIANASSDATILAFADTTSTVTYYNGDDALVLFNGTDSLDIIGIVGNDPGTNWTVGTGATSEYTLVRKATVDAGTTDWTQSATEWDVYAQNTWTYGGAHTSNCAGITPPAPSFDVVAINTFNGMDSNGVVDSLGAMKWIKGLVTSIDFDGNAGYSFYVTDGTASINIYNFADKSGYTSPMMGDSLYIHGSVAQYNGLTELNVDSIFYIGGNYTLPAATVVSTVSEATESELVQLIGFSLVTPSQWPASGSSANVDITNGTDTLTMRIDSDTDIDGSSAPAGMFDVTGIGSQFDNSSPYTEGYQLFPRMLTDIYEYPVIPLYNISDVTGVNAAGMPDSSGVMCKLEGIVMGVDMQGSASSVSFTIHDGVDGIGTFSSVAGVASYVVTEGDEVRIIGSIGQYNGLLQMYIDSLVVLSTGNALPTTPTVVTSLSEATESELIKFENATLVDPTQWGSGSSGYSIDITNGTDTIVLRIDADVNLYGTTAPTGAFDVVGIGGQFTFNAANFDGYQILPRYLSDITPAAAAWSPELYVSEIMAGSNSSAYNADWFEITNYGDSTINLAGYTWDDESGIAGTVTFPSVTIAPGQAIVVLDDVAANKDAFLAEWKLYAGSVTIVANDEMTGSFPSLSQNGDGVYLFDANGAELTNSTYAAATAGYSVEFDTTGAFTGDAVDGVNGAYSSLEGDVASPGNGTPNSGLNEANVVRNIYPNPTSGEFTIAFGAEVAYNVSVSTLTGEVLVRTSGTGTEVRMNLNAAKGTYLVQVLTERGAHNQVIVLQ
jgi:predicted extracellular nuclease